MMNTGGMVGGAARRFLAPRIARHVIGYGNYFAGEPELRLLRFFCDPVKMAVDVGANYGAYTYWLTRYCSTVAVEPLPDCAVFLQAAYPEVKVFAIALGDSDGEGQMELPSRHGKTFHTEAKLNLETHDLASSRVQVKRLDDLGLYGIGFIKVDVEGHELAVLNGAKRILHEDKPVLLIECEERHREGAVSSILDLLKPMGYEVGCLTSSGLRRVADEESAYAAAKTVNFLFVHGSDSVRVRKLGTLTG
jgi:FkbM family methyltransferase